MEGLKFGLRVPSPTQRLSLPVISSTFNTGYVMPPAYPNSLFLTPAPHLVQLPLVSSAFQTA